MLTLLPRMREGTPTLLFPPSVLHFTAKPAAELRHLRSCAFPQSCGCHPSCSLVSLMGLKAHGGQPRLPCCSVHASVWVGMRCFVEWCVLLYRPYNPFARKCSTWVALRPPVRPVPRGPQPHPAPSGAMCRKGMLAFMKDAVPCH